jgi:hypothetical protein
MANPRPEHWEAMKWIFRYLKGTSATTLCLKRGDVVLQGFVDADLGGDLDRRKSTSGYVFTLNGTALSWMSRLTKCVELSTTEAEYLAISEAGKEMVWLLNFFQEIGKDVSEKRNYTPKRTISTRKPQNNLRRAALLQGGPFLLSLLLLLGVLFFIYCGMVWFLPGTVVMMGFGLLVKIIGNFVISYLSQL